ncbi:hypothetical protein SDC9_50286 [bioreactor metagenome]|uniref:Plasmid stabilization system protein n=1 Tax=bioreactor metagenome TaxID=1076179 RepID=A0A644WK75_9ZZZZ
MKTKIVWSEPALNELVLIYQYLLDNTSIAIAKGIIEDVLNTKQIESFPQSGTIESNLKKSGKEYRYILRGHNKYKIIYRITSTVIYITDVFDCRKDPSSMKK